MKVLISGAAGFIGTHAAARFMRDGATVVGLDNLSRPGSAENLEWLRSQVGELVFRRADIREAGDLRDVFVDHPDIQAVVHLAGQVAVTTSVADPRSDFEANALGTLNLLEAVRAHAPAAAFLYASTNKVYGALEAVDVVDRGSRYEYRTQADGIDESFPLDFHSPYGCSKGAADQYVRDYHRIYRLKSVVFRQSCIYGTRQFGVEDQGWISWFTIAALSGRPITVYGDGKQIRDVLWIDDLVDLYVRAIDRIDVAAGEIYNVGGGPGNSLSLLELLTILREETGCCVDPVMANWRPGDQRVFVAGIAKAARHLDWTPRVCPRDGLRRLIAWVRQDRDLVDQVIASLPQYTLSRVAATNR